MIFDITYTTKKRITDKQAHRLFQMLQPHIDLRRFARFSAQSIKFEKLEKREKDPICRKYYRKLSRLKQERAMMYYKRYTNKHLGGIGTPSPNTGEMVVTKEQATKLTRCFKLK